MYEAILIGFKYEGDLYLPGIAVDLYSAYKFCKTAGANVTVITDIMEDEKTEYLTKAIFNDVVDANVVSFISKIKERGEYIYIPNENAKEILRSYINDILENTPPRLFIYFTGHGLIRDKDNGLLLPSRELFSFYELRNRIMTLPIDTEIVWINDCCHLSGIQLPYKLANDGFYESSDGYFCPVQKLIYLSSTSVDEKSMISREGSVFSGVIFKRLLSAIEQKKTEYRDIRILMTDVKERLFENVETRNQQPSFFSSYPTVFALWPWVFGKKIYIDDSCSTVVFINEPIIEGRNEKDFHVKNLTSFKWKQSPIEKSILAKSPEISTVCWNDFAETEIDS